MRLSFCLAVMKDKINKKKKKKNVGRKRSIVKADSRSAITCRDIPEEILEEILVRLPADSLMRFKCVSKLWSSLISSRYFTNLFFKFSSSKRERRVLVYTNDCNCKLFSSSLINLDATESFLQLNNDLTLPGIKEKEDLKFVNGIKGLVCFRVRTGIGIINLATRQVLSLPLLEYDPRCNLFVTNIVKWNYLGYDSVNDEYKVLNVFSYVNKFLHQISKGKYARSVRSETQVLVMGAGASWRKTKSSTSPPPPHRPYGQGMSINGVLYYVACHYHNKRDVVMSFDLNSEDFNLIEFPMEAHVERHQGFISRSSSCY